MAIVGNENCSIQNTTKSTLPRVPFVEMKEAVLGKDYDLSVVFVDVEHMTALNLQYRKLDQPTDILSFPISDTEGEIFINLEETKKEAVKFDREYENFLAFLFIHGLTHLKGFDHSSTMEHEEEKIRRIFKV
ncbi:rRNA maturation RNase YbeY [Patescibacteria group bacterium]|nr:MAG: rRNA maturation RNase YbeY [Patescibacteria group bacterium]